MPPFLISLIWMLGGLAAAGVLLWGIEQVPMDDMVRKLFKSLVVVILCLWFIWFLLGLLPASAAHGWGR